MWNNDMRTYLEQFWKSPEIWDLRRKILEEWLYQNLSDLKVEMLVESVISINSVMVSTIIWESWNLTQQIQSDLKGLLNLMSLEKLKKDNWYYIIDSDHPNIEMVMLEMVLWNKREYHRLYQESILCLQHINICSKWYFDANRENWKQESYVQKYSNYIILLREMCEIVIINQMIEEKWWNTPDTE